jgi:hypothetical protein
VREPYTLPNEAEKSMQSAELSANNLISTEPDDGFDCNVLGVVTELIDVKVKTLVIGYG